MTNYFELTDKKERKAWLENWIFQQIVEWDFFNKTVGSLFLVERDISRIDDRIAKLENKKKELKERRQKLLIKAQDISPEKDYKTFLYWMFRNSPVSRREIDAMKIPYTSTCPKCGEKGNFEIVLKSWAELDAEASKKDNVSRVICSCVKKQQEERERLYQKNMELRAIRLHALKTMPYGEYLQTDEWQETRRKALKRAQFKCQLCNSGGQLNVHHRTYERRGEEDYTDLIVLCKNCHSKHHDKIQE